MEWRQRRRALYLGIPILLMVLIAGFLSWRAYKSASCDDGRQNGGEIGIDCEGPCPKICESRIKPLVVEWTRIAEVEPGRYNVMALLNNENEDLSASSLSYTLSLFEGTTLLWKEEGETVVPAGVKFAVFEGPVRLSSAPDRATIEIGVPSWQKTGEGADIELLDNRFSDLETSPVLETALRSSEPVALRNVEVAVALYDDNGNAIHLSNTVLPSIPARGEVSATYTWPRPFGASQGVCLEPFATMLAIDRSGSMNEDSLDPPEPLASVKRAALFAKKIGDDDRGGLVTFATEATLDQELSRGSRGLIEAIESVSIRPEDEEGYTNIGDALRIAREEIGGYEGSKSIVLLTDGNANWPLKPTGEAYALGEAEKTRGEVPLFVIGLGAGVDTAFLESLAGDPSKVFRAGTTEELDSIYADVATRVCEREPFLVEVYPKVWYGKN
jgi:Mg-chelatase subunit ChlD